MAKTNHGLPETKGSYQAVGVVTGVNKEKFFSEITTKTEKEMRFIKFGVDIDDNKTVYLDYSGMVKDNVYFYKSGEKDANGKRQKGTVKKVAWENRLNFNEKDFNLLGTRLGLEKDEDGKNVKVNLPEYDACQHIKNNLSDGMSVFTKGKIEFGSFEKNGNMVRTTKFSPEQISRTSSDIDFKAEGYESKAHFSQRIIFMGIDKKEDESTKEKYFVVNAKIVTYNSIEDTEFIVKNSALAKQFNKALKPYNSIQVHGNIVVSEAVQATESESDGWGDSDPTKTVFSPTKRELIITGADGQSIEKEVYTEKIVQDAIASLNQADSANGDWGKSSNDDDDDGEW